METPSRKRKLLFATTRLNTLSGAACVAAWSLQALAENWDITLASAVHPDFGGVDASFGTRLIDSDITVRTLPFPLSYLSLLDPDPFSIQDLAWLMRLTQKISRDYDVAVATVDEFDFGRTGIQYIHFPYMRIHLSTFQRVEGMNRAKRFREMLKGRVRPWLVSSGIQLSRVRQNRTITNSHWTASRIREAYQVEAAVLYPPVRWSRAGPEWSLRQPGFAMIGRISPDKRPIEIIDILQRVRARGHAIHLDIVGSEDAVAGKPFVRKVRERAAAAGDWVRLHVGVNRDELETIVSNCRYGIHGLHDEHFGIGVGELVRAGCVVFVPDSGGQVEIVGREPNLCYSSDDDAVERICRVLSDPAEQSRLSAVLEEQAGLFTEEHFMQGMRKLVEDFAARRPQPQ